VAKTTSMIWDEALAAYDRELLGRGAAERTRRAYRNDLRQFVAWAVDRGLADPGGVQHRDVRLFAARLSESGAAAATVARKLASVRGFYDHLVRSGELGQNPADLVGSPKRPGKLPKVLAPDQMAELLDRIPAHSPLEVRDRAMF
jgi:site-specific recombinase XerC